MSEDSDDDNVKLFQPKKVFNTSQSKESVSKEVSMTLEELAESLEIGLENFSNTLSENTRGFLAISFDFDGTPNIVWGGEIELISAIGSLEVAKNDLFKHILTDTDTK